MKGLLEPNRLAYTLQRTTRHGQETTTPGHIKSRAKFEREPLCSHSGSGTDHRKIPRLVIGSSEHQLLVYHALSSTVCLLVPAHISVDKGLIDRLDGHMGTALTNMSADLLDVFGRGTSSNSGRVFVSPLFPTITCPQ